VIPWRLRPHVTKDSARPHTRTAPTSDTAQPWRGPFLAPPLLALGAG